MKIILEKLAGQGFYFKDQQGQGVNCGKEIPEDHGVCQECINLLISTTLTRENERSREILTKM